MAAARAFVVYHQLLKRTCFGSMTCLLSYFFIHTIMGKITETPCVIMQSYATTPQTIKVSVKLKSIAVRCSLNNNFTIFEKICCRVFVLDCIILFDVPFRLIT